MIELCYVQDINLLITLNSYFVSLLPITDLEITTRLNIFLQIHLVMLDNLNNVLLITSDSISRIYI